MKRKLRKLFLLVAMIFVLSGTSFYSYAAENTEAQTEEMAENSDDEQDVAAEGETTDAAESGENEVGLDESVASGIDMDRFNVVGNVDGLADNLSVEYDNTTADTFLGYFKLGVIILGIVVVATSSLLIVFAIKKKGNKSKIFNCSAAGVTAIALVGIIAGNWAVSTYQGPINQVMSKTKKTTDSSISTSNSDWIGLAQRIAADGMVLMKNDNNVLPMSSGQKINLLGYYAYNPFYSGSGSSNVADENSVSIVSSLESVGFDINPHSSDPYTVEDAEGHTIGFDAGDGLSILEASIDDWSGDCSFDAMKEYSDTAVIVLGRTGGEGNDCSDYGIVDGYNYLQLGVNERDMLEAASQTFENLIVIINSANAMDMDFVDEYGVDAVIWAAEPGPYGFDALGKIMTGEINPSGKLPDTWVYDNYSAPASENFGDQSATNSDVAKYVDYVEGIYVGYKWYETAYEEGAVITNTTNGKTYDYNDYYSVVAYPFGYGLSYTTFSQEITGGTLTEGTAIDPRGKYSVEVTVTNTGDVAGKDAVQLYVSAPYTDYDKAQGVEKAAVSLCGIGKTDELEPGESEVITIDWSMEDIASYDDSYDNGNGTTGAYMLDDGSYHFSIRSDSHNELDSVEATLGESYFYSGENKRDSDDQQAYNQFDEANRGEYLSRQDGFANYESAMNSVSTDVKSTEFDDNPAEYDSAYDEAVTKEYVEGVDYAVKGDLTLADVAGLDYDDETWDELIKQLTIDELKALVTDSTYASPRLESINKSKTCDTDGALGVSNMFHAEYNGIAYPCIPLLAATFDIDLAYEMGAQVADQCHYLGITGWYSPAMDTHRWAFSGRNFEYFSEDGVLAGILGASESKGARDKGLIVYIKHFALNDQETNRANHLHTYSNEQAIREIYLKPFEMTFKNGDATAVMNSMNYIGDTYAACSEPLMTEVLRNEWGFRGKALTDMASDGTFVDGALRAGTDAWLSIFALDVSADTNADIYYLQKAAHNTLYAEANAAITEVEEVEWMPYVYAIYALLAIWMLAGVAALVIRNKKNK